jgi:hypothetical protein
MTRASNFNQNSTQQDRNLLGLTYIPSIGSSTSSYSKILEFAHTNSQMPLVSYLEKKA